MNVHDTCSKHPDNVVCYEGSLDELAKAIGNMKYDRVAALLQAVGDDLQRQTDGDAGRKRMNLAGKLYEAAGHVYKARESIHAAWSICEPYMRLPAQEPSERHEHDP